MAVTFDDYITLISFGISIVSVVVVISLAYSWGKRVKPEYHNAPASPDASEDKEIEVSAIVSEFGQRLRRLEESLVDQKVKMELYELRASRSPSLNNPISQSIYPGVEHSPAPVENLERPAVEKLGVTSGIRALSPKNNGQPEFEKKLGQTEMGALRLVHEGRGKISAREIQQRIGRTREHTARMMNALYHDGLVERDVTARPFSYSITEKGRELLNG